ncbi:hypothetical protein B0A78_03390 [Flavobacterium columnare NBRC 100251 = ATCC 23463]|uniref:hypothetical protein n=1 Tax=Flavobacterium columnare TaxID=996 RepID=UPI000BE86E6E|nr:hypothetical protein [Flavobacterium columnare]PDS26062.1 hypothetical protein B0A78_03390 [Flavobacterium columnare NBRC 100251 = ATCC 23463]QHJ72902.1 hypothetical protein [Flavobacterium phage fF4]GEM58405.1 hypothetical protein FC1_16430 [Flavobacterium columnare NBRC 100251 = ATCC 23463]
MQIINEIILKTRGTGNTSWILQSAIENPECVIVSKNISESVYLKKAYRYLLSKSPWYRKIWWKCIGRKHPLFVSIYANFDNCKCPVIFDNGALYSRKKN